MKINMYFIVVIVALMLLAGCSMFEKPSDTPVAKGDKTVCILFKKTRFKEELVASLSGTLSEKGYTLITDTPKHRKHYWAEDYAAIVYMAERWAWHTPRHAIRFYTNNNQAQNMFFVITSADPNVVIQKPFDAVTSASSPDLVDVAAKKVLTKLSSVLGL